MRKQYDERFKAKVALEAVRDDQTLAQIGSRYRINPNQVGKWKKVLVAEAPRLFRKAEGLVAGTDDRLVEGLYEQIGRLQVELEWLKKTGVERR
jgi:transposase-like protein